MEKDSISLHDLQINAEQAEAIAWQGREALRLENGLALVPNSRVRDASIEVLIGTDGPAYPGVAFRIADLQNFELAYAVPHVSGEWDALQYDPVFHGSNTWQLYHGPGYQHETQVPTGHWFQLKVEYRDTRAAVSVDGQSPLVVERLAHSVAEGQIGLWTFRPAYFCELQVVDCKKLDVPSGKVQSVAEGVIEDWFVEGYGMVSCEPNGAVNLNRYIPISMEKARLIRSFETSEGGEIRFDFGFSDVLTLELDGEVVYYGEHRFAGFTDRAERGYAELGMETVSAVVAPGKHELAAELEVSEGFGWGLVLSARGEGLSLLPVESS
jgi:hypothetical protein